MEKVEFIYMKSSTLYLLLLLLDSMLINMLTLRETNVILRSFCMLRFFYNGRASLASTDGEETLLAYNTFLR